MTKKKNCAGYAAAPWRFTGRALYQMHLVRAETARRYVPAELKLVQAFGYTLGGFYLAHYDDSPVGEFDELVVIAGIVWNPPSSCAWAARVLVNDYEACRHGRQEVGLPSYFAKFNQTVDVVKKQNGRLRSICDSLWKRKREEQRHGYDIVRDYHPWCHMSLPHSLTEEATHKGPSLRFSLPSFSGKTEQQPNLLKYSCDLSCRVAVSKPASVQRLEQEQLDADTLEVLTSRPVCAFTFENMTLTVQAPTAP